MTWSLQGKYFENCSCEVACPCTVTSLSAPADTERCRALLAFHVDSGEVEGVDVSGLTVAMLLDAPAQMVEGGWRVGLFLDGNGDDAQREKLAGVFTGELGGPFAMLAPLIAENLGVEVAPIDFSQDGRTHRIKIGDMVDVEVQDVTSPLDPDAPAPVVTGIAHPAGPNLTVAQAVTARVDAMGLSLSHDGRSAFSAPFAWSA